MINKRAELIKLLENDPFELLKNENGKPISQEDDALISSFEEIQDYVSEKGKEPQSNFSNIIEFKLFARLKAIRSDSKKIKKLKKYDFCNLLNGDEIREMTIDDIISDDQFGLLSDDLDANIFKLHNVKAIERIKPEYMSRRKVCRDFFQYKDQFSALQEDLRLKKRRLIKYTSPKLDIGHYYVLGGILYCLSSIEGDFKKYKFSTGDRDRFDGRTLCVFENGTQSDMLFRSLDKAMQIDGYAISDLITTNNIEESVNELDASNGYIYILRSLNSELENISDLYKIGCTTGLVNERIKNAKNEATYVFGEVEVVSTYRCFNIQSYNLEQTIHNFFSSVRLDIELMDRNKNSYKPREWFKVKISIIEDAINLIINNKINEYMYDSEINQIIKKEENI